MIQRRGFTLIEMLLTMSVGSALMLLAMSLLQQAMTLSSQSRHQANTERTINRLCDQFRRDAFAASNATTSNSDDATFDFGSHQVRYHIGDGSVTRTTTSQPNGSQPEVSPQNDTFLVGDSSNITIESLEQPQRVQLTVRYQSPLKHVEPRIDRQIAVTVGRLVNLNSNSAPNSSAETQP